MSLLNEQTAKRPELTIHCGGTRGGDGRWAGGRGYSSHTRSEGSMVPCAKYTTYRYIPSFGQRLRSVLQSSNPGPTGFPLSFLQQGRQHVMIYHFRCRHRKPNLEASLGVGGGPGGGEGEAEGRDGEIGRRCVEGFLLENVEAAKNDSGTRGLS